MSTPLVSIIVPCYNQAKYLSETLDSVLSQTYKEWECVIVNDGSSDNTKEIAQQYCRQDIRFKYIEQENQGLANTRNNGIKASKGTYILPLDADDKIGPTYLELAIKRFSEYPNTTLVYCKAELFGIINQPWNLPNYNYSDFIWENCIFCSAIFKRSDYDKTSGYNPNMKYGFEDWDFWLSLLDENSVVFQLNKSLFYYRIKNQSMTNTTHEHIEETYMTIYSNHVNIYTPYCNQILILKNNSIIQNDRNKDMIESAKRDIQNKIEFKIGAIIIKPLNLIRSIFKHVKR